MVDIDYYTGGQPERNRGSAETARTKKSRTSELEGTRPNEDERTRPSEDEGTRASTDVKKQKKAGEKRCITKV
jgi:hypothetical protein